MAGDAWLSPLWLSVPISANHSLPTLSKGYFSMSSRDLVLVYVDTKITLSGPQAASKLHIPVAHVKAGLRSLNRRMSEGINLTLTDHVSTLSFCPKEATVANLRHKGFFQILNDGGIVVSPLTISSSTYS